MATPIAPSAGLKAVTVGARVSTAWSGALAASAFAQSVLVGLINLIFTLLGMALVDRVGRRLMLIIGAAGMAISLLLVGAAFAADNSGAWLLVPILGYVACFAASTGVVTWVIIAEILPNRVRGRAMSVAVVALWAACYLVSQTFPMLLESVGAAWTFFGYASMNVVTFLFAWSFVPETKGRSLEEIEDFWR